MKQNGNILAAVESAWPSPPTRSSRPRPDPAVFEGGRGDYLDYLPRPRRGARPARGRQIGRVDRSPAPILFFSGRGGKLGKLTRADAAMDWAGRSAAGLR